MDEVHWAAALFVGEGYVHTLKRRRKDGSLSCIPSLAVKMLDGRAIERFSNAFGLHYSMGLYERDGVRDIFNVRVSGEAAKLVLAAMFPYMAGTKKGDQCAQVFSECGIDSPDTDVMPWADTRVELPPALEFSKRRPRSWLLDKDKFNQGELIWAAGLFVGEGYAGVQNRRNRGKTYHYPMLSVSMLDPYAVERFGAALFARPFTIKGDHYSTGECYRVHLNGSTAEAALRAMYPHLAKTDKGDQVRRVFEGLGLDLHSDGSGDTWPRTNGWVGRRLSKSHRAALHAGRDAYWKRWHSGQ